MSKNSNERSNIYKKLRDILSIRGKLLHGGIHPKQTQGKKEYEEAKYFVEEVVRKIIVKFLDLKSQNTFPNDYKDNFESLFMF